MPTWWLSFATNERSLGVMLVDAPTFEDAVAMTHVAKVNPGGEVAGAPIDEALATHATPEERAFIAQLPRMTLIQRSVFQAFGHETVSLREAEELSEGRMPYRRSDNDE